MIKSVDAKHLQKALKNKINNQIHTLKKHGRIPKKKGGIIAAVDMHLIPRYDKKPGEELTRSRYKDGTTYFERYMTVQCVDANIKLNLGAVHLGMLDSVPNSLHNLLESVRNAGVKVRLVMLDREFFSVDVITLLQKHDIPFLIPCKNTGNVVSALREFAQKRRSSISENIIKVLVVVLQHMT